MSAHGQGMELVCAGQPSPQQQPSQGPEGGTVWAAQLNNWNDSGPVGHSAGLTLPCGQREARGR